MNFAVLIVSLSLRWHQRIDSEERRRTQKTASNRTENNTTETFHWLVLTAVTVTEAPVPAHPPKGGQRLRDEYLIGGFSFDSILRWLMHGGVTSSSLHIQMND